MGALHKSVIFLIDPNEDALRALGVPPQGLLAHVATNEEDAELLLSRAQQSPIAIFINPKISQDFGISLLKAVRKHFPMTPVMFITEDGFKLQPSLDLACLTVGACVGRPASWNEIIEHTKQCSTRTSSETLLNQPTYADDGSGQTEDSEFVGVSAQYFVAEAKANFDVYVRLGPNRYVKILRVGDSFSAERLQSYRERGVQTLYLSKKAQGRYLTYCEKLVQQLSQKPNVDLKEKQDLILTLADATAANLIAVGIDEESVAHAREFVASLDELVKAMSLTHDQQLGSYLSDVLRLEHGVATAMVASFLAEPLKFESSRSVSMIGLAALFHDVGLLGYDEKFMLDDVKTMNTEELKLYYGHPARGAEMLRRVGGIEPIVLQSILQHHERRDRTGFPAGSGTNSINRVAEVVAVSEAFVGVLKRAQGNRLINVFSEMEAHVLSGFSPPIANAFRDAFKKK